MADPKEAVRLAYEQGVRDVLHLAQEAADSMPRTDLHATRSAFAEAALRALAEEARALIAHEIQEAKL